MEVTIKGDAKEIAALVVAIQERLLEAKVTIRCSDVVKAIRDRLQESEN